ncbi:MAG TPA: ATP-binding protein [Myxococcaceae bacterium]|jgi:signal transduction histidine kinase
MRRRAAIVLAVLVTALAAIGAAVRVLIARDREALLEELEREHHAQLQEAARRFGDDLHDIGDNLRFAGGLLASGGAIRDHERELRTLVEVVGQYKALSVTDASGRQALFIADPHAPGGIRSEPYASALASTSRAALAAEPGALSTSLPILLAEGEFRAFATTARRADQGLVAVAVLVDIRPLMAPFRLLAAQPGTRLLMLGAHGRPTSASDPALARAALDGATPLLQEGVARMRAGRASCLRLPEQEAVAVGFDAAPAVMCEVPIPVADGDPWSAATVTSTRTLAAHERRVSLRIGGAALLVTAFLAVFAAYVVAASRRAVALREAQRHADRLAHLHERVRKILDNIPTGVLALSAGRTISTVNRALQDRLGAVAPAGQPLASAFPRAPGAVHQRLDALLDRAQRAGEVQSLFGERLALFGDEGQFNVHAVPLEPLDPEVRALLVVEDISNVRALESQLVRAEKLASIGVLAAGVAHEIGTPLGVVRGRAEYLLGKTAAGSTHASGLGVIIEQIDQVSRTLRQLLDFSRIQPAAARPTPLEPIVENVLELLGLEAQRRSIALSAALGPGLSPMWADPDQLQQVLVNLVLNAFDACASGGRVVVGASPGEEGWAARITVQDDGYGVPEELRARVFDPFFTTKKRGQGTGLGLAIVAQIVRNHGGQIELESAEGGGTRVTVLWPSAPRAGAGAEEGSPHVAV